MDMSRIIDLSVEEKIFYYETDDDNDTTYHIASSRATAAYTLCGKDIEAEELETEGDQRKPYGDICLICSQDFERSQHEHALAMSFIIKRGGIKDACYLIANNRPALLFPNYSADQQRRIINQVTVIAQAEKDTEPKASAARDHALQSLADLDRMIDTNRTAAEIHAQIAAIIERVNQL